MTIHHCLALPLSATPPPPKLHLSPQTGVERGHPTPGLQRGYPHLARKRGAAHISQVLCYTLSAEVHNTQDMLGWHTPQNTHAARMLRRFEPPTKSTRHARSRYLTSALPHNALQSHTTRDTPCPILGSSVPCIARPHAHTRTEHTPLLPQRAPPNPLGHKYTGSVMRLAWPGGACVMGGTGLEMPSDQSDWAERGEELDH